MFSIEVWRRETRNETPGLPMVSLHGPEGPAWLFIFELDELRQVCTRGGSVNDGIHNLRAAWESWFFYDLDTCPPASSGTMKVKYYTIPMPYRAAELLLAIVEDMIEAYDLSAPTRWGTRDRLRVDLSEEYQEWTATLGQGKGSVDVVADEETLTRLAIDMWRDPDSTIDRCYDQILQIARNSTWSADDVAEVRISRDWDGYFWRAGGPAGGLINHGSVHAPDWSTHT
jgi:hypothetical protein